MKKVQIGVVGVDSGQLVLCDPCYIDSDWEKEEFQDIRKYQHKTTGDILQYRVDFAKYDTPIPKYGGQTMNQLTASGEWKELDSPDSMHNFSYNACCKATLSAKGHGQLNYKLGHDGVAVAFSTAYGDGIYPVFANYDDQGELVSVSVHFNDEE
jgi:hypothetical protein